VQTSINSGFSEKRDEQPLGAAGAAHIDRRQGKFWPRLLCKFSNFCEILLDRQEKGGYDTFMLDGLSDSSLIIPLSQTLYPIGLLGYSGVWSLLRAVRPSSLPEALL
jgi:hypothetical protein